MYKYCTASWTDSKKHLKFGSSFENHSPIKPRYLHWHLKIVSIWIIQNYSCTIKSAEVLVQIDSMNMDFSAVVKPKIWGGKIQNVRMFFVLTKENTSSQGFYFKATRKILTVLWICNSVLCLRDQNVFMW